MKNIRKMYTYAFFSNLTFELVIWMLYLKHMGWSVGQIAMLQLVINIVQVVCELPSGIIADWLGYKTTLILGQVMCVLYGATFFVAHNHFLVFGGFTLFGLGLSLISGTDEAIIYEADDEQNYQKFWGRYNAIMICTIAFSNLVGGYLADISWPLVFMASIIAHLLSIMTVVVIKPKQVTADPNAPGVLKRLKSFLFSNRNYQKLILVVAISQATASIMYQYGSLYLSWITSFKTSGIALVLTIIEIIGAVFSVNVFKVVAKFDRLKVIFSSMIIGLLMSLFLGVSNFIIALVAFVIFSSVFEIWDTSLNAELQDIVVPQLRVTLMSFCNLITALLMALESLFISAFSKILNIQVTFVLFGLTSMVLSLIVLGFYFKSIHENSPEA
ncbi:MFS transporter [Fructilactobacillus fructivorans]|nr:MFS transporter [Fructilactobacillus fructivorans]